MTPEKYYAGNQMKGGGKAGKTLVLMKRRKCMQGLVLEPHRGINLGRFWRIWENNIKMCLKEVAYEGMIVLNLDYEKEK